MKTYVLNVAKSVVTSIKSIYCFERIVLPMKLNQLHDQQIAERIVEYIDRLEALMSEVSYYIDGKKDTYLNQKIHDAYKRLKDEIRTDAHYLSLSQNEKHNLSQVYLGFFKPSIMEAAAFGFTSSTNSRIDYKFYSSVAEAHYKLTKYFSLKRWQAIANGKPPFEKN